MAGNMTF